MATEALQVWADQAIGHDPIPSPNHAICRPISIYVFAHDLCDLVLESRTPANETLRSGPCRDQSLVPSHSALFHLLTAFSHLLSDPGIQAP
jgi:hypothetical protein